jgi:hypothetical protein
MMFLLGVVVGAVLTTLVGICFLVYVAEKMFNW